MKEYYSLQMLFGFGMVLGMFNLPNSLIFVKICIALFSITTILNFLIEQEV